MAHSSMALPPLYECRNCLRHVSEHVPSRRCPACGGRLDNIAIRRE